MNTWDSHLALHLIIVGTGEVDWKGSLRVSDSYTTPNECDGWSKISLWTQAFNFHKRFPTLFTTTYAICVCSQVRIVSIHAQSWHLHITPSMFVSVRFQEHVPGWCFKPSAKLDMFWRVILIKCWSSSVEPQRLLHFSQFERKKSW